MDLSWVALVLGIAATFPQLYLTLTTGTLRDYHPWTPMISFVGNFFLALHGYNRKDVGLMFFGAWFMFYNAVLSQYIRNTPASSA
jgi:hypothetical protein